ncbi:MAG: hypothetical protein AAGC60_10775 [Acidobacteriota bacterium]
MREKLSEEQKKARDRMRLVTPETSYKVLGHPRYWTVEFLRLYLDHCDAVALDDPDAACTMAEQAPMLAQRIRVGERSGEFPNEAQKRSLRLLALAVHGSCCRASERLRQAQECFDACEAFLAEGVTLEAAAELKRRQAGLLGMRGDTRALRLVDEALEIFARASGLEGEAEALLLRAALEHRFQRATGLADASRAMRAARLTTDRGQRTVEAALHFLTFTLLDERPTIVEQQQAYRILQAVKKRLAHRPKSLRKMKVFWIEGLLLSSLGITRHAVRRLAKARDGLLSLGHAFELALVSLDLACAHLEDGEPERARRLAAATRSDLEELDAEPEILQSLETWNRTSSIGRRLRVIKKSLLRQMRHA